MRLRHKDLSSNTIQIKFSINIIVDKIQTYLITY